jgi:hypothetical protein
MNLLFFLNQLMQRSVCLNFNYFLINHIIIQFDFPKMDMLAKIGKNHFHS